MFIKTIKYTNFMDEEITGTFYFNLTEAEVADWQYSCEGGISNYLQKIYKAKDEQKLYHLLKDLVLRCYGIRSDDGQHFYKSENIRKEFETSAAFSAIFMELMSSETAATTFLTGVLPKKLASKLPADTATAVKMLEESTAS